MPRLRGHALFGIPESVRFYPLLISMLASIMIAPFTATRPVIGTIVLSAVMLAGILVVGRRRSILAVTLVLVAPAFVVWWLDMFSDSPSTLRQVLASSMTGTYFAFLATVVLSSVLAHKRIDKNTVVGAICVYLLIAVCFAQAYEIIESLDPGSIRGLARRDTSTADVPLSSVYFSFVTITTLGYGDIAPISPIARSTVITETLIGQLFLVGFVARLVSAVAADAPMRRDDDDVASIRE